MEHTVSRLARMAGVIFRELDVPLRRIREILDDPGFDVRESLVSQRALLEERGLAEFLRDAMALYASARP